MVAGTTSGESALSRCVKHFKRLHGQRQLKGVLAVDEYDVVVIKDLFLLAPWMMRVARRAGVPVVYWLSYPFPEASTYRVTTGTARYPLFYRLRGAVFHHLLYRRILPHVDHVFVQSEQMKRDIEQEGISSERMTPVLLAVDVDEIRSR